MRQRVLLCALMAMLATPSGISAQHSRNLDAHEHGHGMLSVVIEGTAVLMEFEAPGADIVGFEHAAESAADKAALTRAEKTLLDPLALFMLPPEADCRLAESEVSLAGQAGNDEHQDTGKSGHDDHDEVGHKEFHATYALSCRTPGAIHSIRFAYFEHFQGAEELSVVIVTSRGQRAFAVSRAVPVISLKGMM